MAAVGGGTTGGVPPGVTEDAVLHTTPRSPVGPNSIHGLNAFGAVITAGPVQLWPESLVMYTSRSLPAGTMTANRPKWVGSAAPQGMGSVVDCSPMVATLGTREPVGGATGLPWLSVTGRETQVCPLSKLA